VIGEPMAFWRQNMPPGMLLRSPAAWHFDPLDQLTLERFITDVKGLPVEAVDPIPVELLLEYGDWFLTESGLVPARGRITNIHRPNRRFVLTTDRDATLEAEQLVLAPGFHPFSYVAPGHVETLPASRVSHTVDFADPTRFAGARVLIVGGRQSAFEFAALLREADARVTISYRHETPTFEASDWTFIDEMIEASERERGWFRRLPAAEQERIRAAFWFEGRGKLEPWLPPRLEGVDLLPSSTITAMAEKDGAVLVELSQGRQLEVDHVMMATGYKVELDRLDCLDPALRSTIVTDGGAPILDEDFMTSVPGLFITGLPAARDFGPFFGFMRACGLSARIIGRRVQRGDEQVGEGS
jgi:thioredoxin reductase